eukprot:9471652-Pyramimonas_sp.AAC.1
MQPRNSLRDSWAREAPKHRKDALARDFLASYRSWCLVRRRVSSLGGYGGVVRIQSACQCSFRIVSAFRLFCLLFVVRRRSDFDIDVSSLQLKVR